MSLEIGDEIKIVGFKEFSNKKDITVGEKYIIIESGAIGGGTGVEFLDDVGDERFLQYFEYEMYNSKRRVHADLINEWADGAEIQYLCGGNWHDIDDVPMWCGGVEYRIKPEKPIERVEYDGGEGKIILSFPLK